MKTKYKPFDLEAAKNGAPVITRDGRLARIVCFDFKTGDGQRLLALIEQSDGTEQAFSYDDDGNYSINKDLGCDKDLVMAPVKKKLWINLYEPVKDGSCGYAYATKEAADYNAVSDRIDCKEVEVEM